MNDPSKERVLSSYIEATKVYPERQQCLQGGKSISRVKKESQASKKCLLDDRSLSRGPTMSLG
jgi:hypothetical protein